MEEYRRVCKLGAAIKESTVYMPRRVNQMTAFKECRRLSLGNSTTKSSLISHFSCISSPASFALLFNFLHCCLPPLPPPPTSAVSFSVHQSLQLYWNEAILKLYYTWCPVPATLPLFAMDLCQTWLLLWEYLCAWLISVTQLPSWNPFLLPISCASLTTYWGRKKYSRPSPSKQWQVGSGAEGLLSSNQQQSVPSCPTLMEPKYWFRSTSCSFLREVELTLYHALF